MFSFFSNSQVRVQAAYFNNWVENNCNCVGIWPSTGTDQQIQHAQQLIREKIEGERGGRGDFNQGGGQNWNQQGWNQQQQQQQQQQPQQGNWQQQYGQFGQQQQPQQYGQQQQQPQQYGQQQQFGGQQPPQQQVSAVDLSMYGCHGYTRVMFCQSETSLVIFCDCKVLGLSWHYPSY